MIEEWGTVVAVEPDAIWVETVKSSTCGACSAKAGCGHHLINQRQAGQRARLRVQTDGQSHSVGDTVRLGLAEGALLRGALWVYGLPLGLLFGGALVGHSLALENLDGAALLGTTGLVLGFAVNRLMSLRRAHNKRYQPQVLDSIATHCQAVSVRAER